MSREDAPRWCPFRPRPEDLQRIAQDVAEIPAIQQKTLDRNEALKVPDRTAHQYQIAGGKVRLKIADNLPPAVRDVGLFIPGSQHLGIGRFSTGLGTPHVEPNPDFLGLLLAFQTPAGVRVDFFGLNDPASPADDHRDFMSILHGTAAAAGSHIAYIGDLGHRDLGNVAASQTVFAASLVGRMGLVKAGRTMLHLTKQTATTFRSSTAYQRYWTGIVELGGQAGKFTLVPARDENHHSGLAAGERLFSDDWKARQQRGEIEFGLHWIAYLDEEKTPTTGLTRAWQDDHKEFVGSIVFPQLDAASEEARLWSILATEMGGNPGNWIANRENTIAHPSTEFGVARTLAYAASQRGRNALAPEKYSSVFATGTIDEALARELESRREAKVRAGHVDQAPEK